MRTTLELDDDLVVIAKRLALQRGVTVGKVISELARQSLNAQSPQKVRNGVAVFTPKAGSVKADLRVVNELRDGA
jgi:hypothetical protein